MRNQIAKLSRFGRYTLWMTGAFALPLALDRIIVLPWVNTRVGPEIFGGFLWVLAIVNLATAVGSNGFSLIILRNFVTKPEAQRPLFLRTALVLTGIATAVILLAAVGFSLPMSTASVRQQPLAICLPLLGFGLFRGLSMVVISKLRCQRRFAYLFGLKAIESLVLLGVILVASTRVIALIGGVYLLSTLGPLIVAVARDKDLIGPGRLWDRAQARSLMHGWVPGAIFTLVDASQLYVPRIFLGAATANGKDVALLYAGTSVGNLFVTPIGLIGGLLLSIIAGHAVNRLIGRRAILFLAAVGGVACGVGIAAYLIGSRIITMIYPDLATQALTFYHWIALANALACIMLMLRPIAVRYGKLWVASMVSVGSLTAQLTALAVLVPGRQGEGAAIAIAIGAGVSALLWIIYYGYLSTHHAQKASQKNPRTAPDVD